MELQDIERRLFEDGPDRRVISIDEQPDPLDTGRHGSAERGGTGRVDGARARRVEHETEIAGAALDGHGNGLLARQPADFGGNGHGEDMGISTETRRASAKVVIPVHGSALRAARG